jgi:hypothetical protein
MTTSTSPSASRCSGRSAGWPKSPTWAIVVPSRAKRKIVFDPRYVPATASCSDEIPTISPSGIGLHEAFAFAIAACLVAALASWSRGGRVVRPEEHASEQTLTVVD